MHAFYAPSASSRWLDCTASMSIDTSHIPRSTSKAAEVGTALHLCAEAILRGKLKPASAAGKTFNKVKITRDQVRDIIKPYLEFVEQFIQPGSELFIEHKARLTDDCWGTSDAVIVTPLADDPTKADVDIIDLKTGAGYRVSPVDNTQLLIYAAGTIADIETIYDINDVRVSICQPPHNVYATHRVTYEHVSNFGQEVIAVIKDIEQGRVKFAPSEDNCRWCPAASICPKLEEVASQAAADDFKGLKKMASKTLAEKAAMVPHLKAFITAIEGEVERRLLEGKKVPGRKLALGNSRRQWKYTEATLEKKLDSLKIPKTWRHASKLRSPNELENLLKEKGKSPDLIAALIEVKEGGPIVVGEDSNRRDYDPSSKAADDFKDHKKPAPKRKARTRRKS